jgi:hypothetical protein
MGNSFNHGARDGQALDCVIFVKKYVQHCAALRAGGGESIIGDD